eukprot:2572726-Rhodomonas_salina.1
MCPSSLVRRGSNLELFGARSPSRNACRACRNVPVPIDAGVLEQQSGAFGVQKLPTSGSLYQ